MPFPWTKNRVTRFSQIVADLQFQSPKRGRSLVLQTGFPTSLFDLFVKNRNRFKKSRFNKPFPTELPDSPPPPPPPSPVTTPPLFPYVSPSESPMPSPVIEEITDEAPVTDRVSERRFVPSAKLVIVKLLTVMILLAIVKGFTVAFTVSAFSLLFLEYAVKCVVSVIKPCSEAIFAMESQFQKVLFQLKTKEKEKEKNEPATVNGGGVEIELNLNLNSSTTEEIEVVESKIELEPLDSEFKIRSRSGRFKAKMVKKLISKKFRCSKKEKKRIEEEKKEKEKEKESKENEGDLISEISSEIERVSEKDYEVDSGTTCSDESKAIGNSGYRILVIIVLVGLIVGRLPALLFTIVWCFLLKIVKAVWKSQSHIKSSVPNS